MPAGRDAGFSHPVVVVTAQEILDESANVIQVVTLTSALREFGSEVAIEPDEVNGLDSASSAQTLDLCGPDGPSAGRHRHNLACANTRSVEPDPRHRKAGHPPEEIGGVGHSSRSALPVTGR